MGVRVEWIGVRSPTTIPSIRYQRLIGNFTEYQNATLEAASKVLWHRIRQVNTTRRRKGPDDGLSQWYQWGETPGSFIQEMTDLDAERLFKLPDEYEFKRVDDPAHERRVPIVPDAIQDETLRNIMIAAHNGPPVSLSAPMVFSDAEGLLKRYEEVAESMRH